MFRCQEFPTHKKGGRIYIYAIELSKKILSRQIKINNKELKVVTINNDKSFSVILGATTIYNIRNVRTPKITIYCVNFMSMFVNLISFFLFLKFTTFEGVSTWLDK
jgi:hypothetical protein